MTLGLSGRGARRASPVALAEFVDDLPCRLTARGVEAHVQRAGRPEAESALAVGELIGREPEVEQDAIGLLETSLLRDFAKLFEVGLAQRGAGAELGQPLTCPGDGRPIGVEPEQAAIR